MSSTYQDFFAALPPSSGSPKGLSHYAKIYECAWKATRLPEEQAVETRSGTSVGTYYHALWHQRPACTESGELTEDQVEALRLYDGYRDALDYPEVRFGVRELGREVELDCGFITARLDNLYEVVDPSKLAAYGVLLPKGARLIHDFKTAASAYQPAYYICGLQGRYYPAMWNVNEGGYVGTVAGILFDEIVKHKELRVKRTPKGGPSFNVHWAPAPMDQPARLEQLRAWCANADMLAEQRARNHASCIDTYGQICPHYHTCHGA